MTWRRLGESWGGLQFRRVEFGRPIRPRRGAVEQATGSVCLAPRGGFRAAGGTFKNLTPDETLKGGNAQREAVQSQGPVALQSPDARGC